MSIAWLGFASIGMFMARYMRHIWETNVCGKKIWFQVGFVNLVTGFKPRTTIVEMFISS